MRTGTDRLRRDHQRIAAVLRALEALAGRLTLGEEVDLRLNIWAQEYLRVFLHGIHRI